MPEPVALVTVIHGTLLTAVHVHCVPETTDNDDPVLPICGTDTEVGVTVAGHPVADCVSVTVFPATVIVPVRVAPVVFAATEYVTEPMPEPVAPVTVIQLSLLTAVHVQLVPEMTDNEPVVAV